MNELVSVIIPTFNRADLLPWTLKSVLNQTYKQFEILVVDDGSTDGTGDVVASFNDERIRFFYIDHHGYPAPARNKGISEAKGSYLALLDSDDLWFPGKLSSQVKAFEKNPDLFLVGTNIVNYPIPSKPVLNLKKDKIFSFREIFSFNRIMTSSVLFKKSIVQEIGLFDEHREFKAVEDYDYWLRLLHAYDKSVLVLKDILTAYRIHEKNMSLISDSIAPLRELQRLVHVYEKYKGTYFGLLQRIISNRLAFVHYMLARTHLLNGEMNLFAFLGSNKISIRYKIKGVLLYCSNRLECMLPVSLRKIFPSQL
jgi:glycosyltransferase involved in cell wall biosynthesis